MSIRGPIRGKHLADGLQRLIARPDWLCGLVLLPVTVALVVAWGLRPNLDLYRYAWTQGMLVAVSIIPAYAALVLSAWLSGRRSRDLLRHCDARGFAANVLGLLVMSWVYSHLKAGVLLRPARDGWLYDADVWLLGSEPWTVLRGWMADGWAPAMHLIYLLFFPVLVASIFSLAAIGDRDRSNRLTAAICVAYYLGVLLYHWIPSYGPAYVCSSAATVDLSPATHRIQQMLLDHVRAVQTGNAAARIQPWCYIGAFPSLHVCHALILCWYLRAYRLAWGLAASFTVATMVSTVYLGWHYVADWWGGVLVAVVAVTIVEAARRASKCPATRGDSIPSVDVENCSDQPASVSTG